MISLNKICKSFQINLIFKTIQLVCKNSSCLSVENEICETKCILQNSDMFFQIKWVRHTHVSYVYEKLNRDYQTLFYIKGVHVHFVLAGRLVQSFVLLDVVQQRQSLQICWQRWVQISVSNKGLLVFHCIKQICINLGYWYSNICRLKRIYQI